jgi:hypothetical protein
MSVNGKAIGNQSWQWKRDPPGSKIMSFLRKTSQPSAGASECARWHHLYAGGQTLALITPF